jgi:hypothetical protein
MKHFIALFFFAGICLNASAQAQEAQQLVLNYEKLQQLEKILDNMYKGYTILTKGYSTIKNIAEGNYNVHDLFLSRLLGVNPVIRDYKRVAAIITYQKFLVSQYKSAWNRFKNDKHLTLDEIRYIESVYGGLVQQSLRNLNDLLTVITAAQLRMSDDERLSAIDRIYFDMVNKVTFLKQFNSTTSMLIVQRARAHQDTQTINKLHNVNP